MPSWLHRAEFGKVKLWFDVVMVLLAMTTSASVFHGLRGVREETIDAMLLIDPTVRTM